MKRFPLWQWGLICIFSGLLVNMMMALQSPTGRLSAQERAAAMGRGVATLLFVVAGVVLIILHFVRRKRKDD